MSYPLEDFYKQTAQMKQIQPQLEMVNFEQFNKRAFKNAIPQFNQMDEHSITILIKNNIDIIADDILHEDKEYVALFQDSKFISAFIRAINSIPINFNIRVACNKITYDYFTSGLSDSGIKHQYLNMSRTVNRDYINKLISIGLDDETATNLALCRFSSINEVTNVKRLNFAIYNRDPNIMTEQMVVWIYEKLFQRITHLFHATMFEVYSPQQQLDFGNDFMEIYGVVGNAVLCILNNMTSDNIRKVLIGYESDWNYANRPVVRFSLHALSNDYERISRVVDFLTASGKCIP